MSWTVKDTENGATVEVDSKSEAQQKKDELTTKDNKGRFEIIPPKESDGGMEAEVIDHTEETPVQKPPKEAETAEVIDSPDLLAKDPIQWLESKNTDFVNTIKGKPAISKQGFRYIQSKFGITTQSEVVQTFDDPRGCIVWAKAELPDGQYAEAHGEGYITESDVSDNEFVRYADTRAKNRAISDLTSAGALAASELSE